jgi:hypothetical protein
VATSVDVSVVSKVVSVVLERKEKRERKRSEKFCVCDVMVGRSCCARPSPLQCVSSVSSVNSVSGVSVLVCHCVSGVSVLAREQRAERQR